MKHHSSRRNPLDQSVLNTHEVAAANRIANASSDFKDFSEAEVASLNRCLELLKQGGNRDPKLEAYQGHKASTDPGRWSNNR